LPRRSVFVIDGSGVVRYVHRALVGLSFRPVAELVAAVEKAKLGQ
jgi:peroxiredoxin